MLDSPPDGHLLFDIRDGRESKKEEVTSCSPTRKRQCDNLFTCRSVVNSPAQGLILCILFILSK
jgi:hypothetical protein